MIGYLEGTVLGSGVILTGGIGWVVGSPDALTPGEKVALRVTTLTRDGTISLYGFCDPQDQVLFEALIKVPKVGPQAALAILRTFSPGEFAQIVVETNPSALTKVPGIGQKTAETIVAMVKVPPSVTPDPAAASVSHEVVGSLISMGFPPESAALAVNQALETTEELSDEELLRQSLNLVRTLS